VGFFSKASDEACYIIEGGIKTVKTLPTLLFAVAFATSIARAQSPLLVTPAMAAPRVEFHTFDSASAKAKVSYHIYTPEIYDTEKERRFPVLYWLHGSGGGLAGIAPVSAWFDAAIRDGKIPPLLVVFPNGLASSMWCDSKDGAVPMETIVIKELLPHIDATFRTIATREGRIIEGFSMGGYGAARLGFKYPQLFGGVSILAGGPLDLDFAGPRATGNPTERERILKGTFGGDIEYYRSQNPITVAQQQADAVRGKVRVRMAVGARDNTGPLNRAYSEHLKKLNIAHTFTIVPGVGHDTLALLKSLGEDNWEFYREAFSTLKPQTNP
jgi:enterochelin esterase-like enzyme